MNVQININELIENTLSKFANTVASTLGPKGKNVIIRNHKDTFVTKDGVTVANNITADDQKTKAIIEIIKKAASNTAVAAGDGTTTSTWLAHSIYNALKSFDNSEIQKRIPELSENFIKKLQKKAKKVSSTSSRKLFEIAKISSNHDEEIASNVVKAVKLAKTEGMIKIEELKYEDFYVEKLDQFKFNGVVRDTKFWNKTTGVKYNTASVFVSEKPIKSVDNLFNVIKHNDKDAILIVCPPCPEDVYKAMIYNRAQFKIVWVSPESYGKYMIEDLHDLSVMAGCKLMSPDVSFASLDKEFIGSIKNVHINDKTMVFDILKENEKDLKKHTDSLRNHLKTLTSEFELDKKRARLANLTNSLVTVYVGHPNRDLLKEKKDRIDDCIHAVKAAMRHGYIRGGGLEMYELAASLEPKDKLEMAYYSALKMPLIKILENSHIPNYEEIVKELESNITKDGKSFGYNPVTNQWEDFYKSNIIDPAHVTTSAIKNATNVALLLLSTEAIVINN